MRKTAIIHIPGILYYIQKKKMARPIREVLTDRELKKIETITNSVSDFSQARVVGNVSHIACDIYTDKDTNKEVVQARVYLDSRGPYKFLIHCPNRKPSKIAKMDYEKRANELLTRRRGHLYESRGRSHERKAFEAKLRGVEIEANRHYIHESEGSDLGLFVAAAHWLKEYSDMFCRLAQWHYTSMGINDFTMVGLERAVVISAPENENANSLYVLAMSSDLTDEEMAAQCTSGLMNLRGDEYASKACVIRAKLEEAEETVHLCILGGKGKR